MGDLLTINVVYSTQHWIFPSIIIGVLVILGAVILIVEGRARVKAGKGLFGGFGNFFVDNYDKVKLWGCVAMTVIYFFLLDIIGFTVCSIVFVFLFNLLFAGKEKLNKRYVIMSALISVIGTLVISILFGTIFNISLPEGICTIWIKSLGITIF